MITFVLAEAELERVPPEIQGHPDVLARAKARGRAPRNLLLDQAVDHEAMRRLPEGDRRGRPDILHFCLLLLLDGPLHARGLVRVLVHTRHDELVRVRPDLRLMRSQPKFYQLMEDLLRQGVVPKADPLLSVEWDRGLASVLDECPGPRVLLDEAGVPARSPFFRDLASTNADLTLVLGAFPRGAWRRLDRAWFDHVVRVADQPVSAWSALVPALAGFEDALLRP